MRKHKKCFHCESAWGIWCMLSAFLRACWAVSMCVCLEMGGGAESTLGGQKVEKVAREASDS